MPVPPSSSEPPPKKNLQDLITLYKPLIIITLISVFAGIEMAAYDVMPFMNAAMGLFLLFLAALKFFDTKGFAETFIKYDPLAAKVKGYAYLYPFIELGLGALFLSRSYPVFTNAALFIVLAITTVGVVRVIKTGVQVKCGCAGAGFNLPVGRVTLFENATMMAMAAFNLLV